MLTEQLDWEKTDGMMPAIVQHAVSGEVLMHGYMNKEALEKTEATGKVTFYSRTKQRLWTKGETSGHVLNVVSITPDCDNDTLLVLVNPIGPTCHKGTTICFGETGHQWLFLYQLEQLLAERKHGERLHGEAVCQRHQAYCAESGGRRRGDRAGRHRERPLRAEE